MYSLATAKIMTSIFMLHSFGENVAINHCSDKHTCDKWKINKSQAQRCNNNGNLNPEDIKSLFYSLMSVFELYFWGLFAPIYKRNDEVCAQSSLFLHNRITYLSVMNYIRYNLTIMKLQGHLLFFNWSNCGNICGLFTIHFPRHMAQSFSGNPRRTSLTYSFIHLGLTRPPWAARAPWTSWCTRSLLWWRCCCPWRWWKVCWVFTLLWRWTNGFQDQHRGDYVFTQVC